MAEKSTPHINPRGVDIADTVLLPGDPRRAKFIAETYLDDVVQFNEVRNMLGYTGTYKGTPVSVMGSGMGMPSIGIYSWELINIFGARNVIRVGSIGSLQEDINLYDIIVASSASTDSNFLEQYNLPGTYAPTASWKLLKAVVDEGTRLVRRCTWAISCLQTSSITPMRLQMLAGLGWVSWAWRWSPQRCIPLLHTPVLMR